MEFLFDRGSRRLLPVALLVISLSLLSACGHDSASSSPSSPVIIASSVPDGSAGEDFVLNNNGVGAGDEVDINFSGEELNSQANVTIESTFKVLGKTPTICTVDTKKDGSGYDVTFHNNSEGCEIALYSTVKSTGDSTGSVQFSAVGQDTVSYSYTNEGYLLVVMGGVGIADSTTYHDGSWTPLVTTGIDMPEVSSSPRSTLSGTIYLGGSNDIALSYYPAVNSYTAANGWGEPTTLGHEVAVAVAALVVAPDGTVYVANRLAEAADNELDFSVRATDGTWTTTSSPFDEGISTLALAPDGTLYAGSFVGTDNFATYDNGSWSDLSTNNSEGNGAFLVAPDGTLYALNAAVNEQTNQLAIRATDGNWTLSDGILEDTPSAMAMAADGTLYVASGVDAGMTNMSIAGVHRSLVPRAANPLASCQQEVGDQFGVGRFASYADGHWTDLSSDNNPLCVSIFGIAIATDNTIYLAGDGYNDDAVAIYDPSDGSWTTLYPPTDESHYEGRNPTFYNVLSLSKVTR